MILITIDPSIRAAGLAMFYDSFLQAAAVINQKVPAGQHWLLTAYQMADAMAYQVGVLTEGCTKVHVVTEMPDNWGRGRGEDSRNRGDIQKLYTYVGIQTGLLRSNPKIASIHAVVPSGWKGTTPKRITIQRSIAYLQSQDFPDVDDHNANDAVMIGKRINEVKEDGVPQLRLPKQYVQIFQRQIDKTGHPVGSLHLVPNPSGISVHTYCR